MIINSVGDRYARLPMVVGPGADKRVREFVALMRGLPTLKRRVRAGILVADRRWNVALKNGVEVYLPEADPEAALVSAGRASTTAAGCSPATSPPSTSASPTGWWCGSPRRG